MAAIIDILSAAKAAIRPIRFAAIDIDSSELRIAVAVQSGGKRRITRLARVEMPEGLELTDAPAIGAFLAASLKELRISVKWIEMSVPRCQAVLTPLQLPAGTAAEELPGMVQYQVEKELPFRIDEAVVDFAIARHFVADASADVTAKRLNVLVAAVRLPVVEHYKQIALSAGVKLLRLGLRSNADLRCVRACIGQDHDAPVAIVHVTTNETEIDVMDGPSLAFSRSAIIEIPRTGQSTEAASDHAASMLAGEVVRSLQTFQVAERGNPISRILLAGSTGVEARVSKTLARRLGIQCERFNPAEALKLADDGSASGFISALGMAIGSEGQSPRTEEMDFLNPKRPRIRHNARKARNWLAPAAAAVVVLAAIFAMGSWVGGKKARVKDLRREIAQLEAKSKQVKAFGKPIDIIDAWLDQQLPWSEHLANLSSVMPPCQKLYVASITSTRDGELRMAVLAKSDSDLEDMKARLRGAEYRFSTDGVSTKDNVLGYNYSTSVDVVVNSAQKLNLDTAKAPPRPDDDMSAEMSANYNRPAASYKRPAVSSGRPVANSERPAASYKRPARSSRRPNQRQR